MKVVSTYIDTLQKALERTKLLMEQENADYEEIHSVKSVLYAAIERLGVKADRLSSTQRILRELFAIVTTKADIKQYERQVAQQLLRDLFERYQKEVQEVEPKVAKAI